MALVSIVEALADCLETLRLEGDLQTCLERYPEYQVELQALLEVASLIRPLPDDVLPSPEFREATRSRILELCRMFGWHPFAEGTQEAP